MEKNNISRLAPEIREQAEEVCKIEEAMRAKVSSVLPEFPNMDLAQRATTTQGEEVWKANPKIQEARALFRDYTAIVKAQRDIFESNVAPADVSQLSDLRERFKVAK